MPRALVCCMALLAVACESKADLPGAVLDGDPVMFATEVQPVIQRHCAFIGCHGREGMPLPLYAVDYLRLVDPQRQEGLDELALLPIEVTQNRRAIAARAGPTDPTGARVTRRLIPLSIGGVPHADVVVFDRLDDPDLAALRRFMRTVRAL